MDVLLCPACQRANRPTVRRCAACGTALTDFDTVPGAPPGEGFDADATDSQVGALWLDDMRAPLARPTPVPAQGSLAAAAVLPGLTVREITLPAPAPVAPPPPNPGPPPVDRAARVAVKVAQRAAVRRARLAAAPLPVVCDILLVDAEASARQQLGELLDDLGFHVRPVATLAQAAVLAAHHSFAAVFVAVRPEAIDSAVHDLFEQVRATGRRAGCAAAVRVLVAAQWRPVDRVRAELAGCEETLARPVCRRDLARVLDSHGIALPHDPRRR